MKTIYEFITPSDSITFRADNDKIAFACAILIGNGKAGCENTDTNESIPSMLIFSKDPSKEIDDYIGGSFKQFFEENKTAISESLLSFAYTSISNRRTYDMACDAIKDAAKLQEFKETHENENRTSMSKWVIYAWNLGGKFSKN